MEKLSSSAIPAEIQEWQDKIVLIILFQAMLHYYYTHFTT